LSPWPHSPDGGWAEATVTNDRISVRVGAGEVLDEIVLRSYCIGAAHMGYSLVTAEQLAVDSDGVAQDLTVRSFGVVRASDTPTIEIDIADTTGPAVNASDAVFAAVAAATALHHNATAISVTPEPEYVGLRGHKSRLVVWGA